MKTILIILFTLFISCLQADTTSYTYSFEHYYDKEDSYNITNISEASFTPTSPVIVFKNKPHTHWYKIQIENTSNNREDIVIYNAKSYYNTIKYYETNAHHTLLNYSDVSKNIAYEEKDFLSTLPAFRFELEAGSKKNIYVQTQADIYFISKFHVITEDDFRLTRQKQNAFYIFYFGICLAIGIYFLVLFIINKERLYLYYFVYTMLLAHFTYIYSAMYVYVNGNWLYYGFAILPLTYVFLLLITQKMLENEKKLPYFSQIILAFNISFVSAGVVMLFDQTLASHIYHVLLLLLIVLANVLLFSSSKKNRIYFIAVFIYLMSMVSMPLMSMQIIPYNFVTKNIIMFGSMIELFLFSFVLANHVHDISMEKLKSEAKLSEIQKDQNERLQIQVAKQTKSLNFLLKEVHHRVKNNFQFITGFIWAQKQQNNSKDALLALEQIDDRVFSISALHELLSVDESSDLNLQDYIPTIIKSFRKNHDNITYTYDIAHVNVDYDTSIALGLIVNELLTNSAKYAFEHTQVPTVNIRGYKEENTYHFEYSDNGIGFDTQALDNATGFGHEFITEFIFSLPESNLQIQGDKGFSLHLTFSLPPLKSITDV